MGLFKKKQTEPEVLAESWSPVCNIHAFAEEKADHLPSTRLKQSCMIGALGELKTQG